MEARALLGCDRVAHRSHTAGGMLAFRSLSRSNIALAKWSYYCDATPYPGCEPICVGFPDAL